MYLMFFVNFDYSLLNSFVCIGVLLLVPAMCPDTLMSQPWPPCPYRSRQRLWKEAFPLRLFRRQCPGSMSAGTWVESRILEHTSCFCFTHFPLILLVLFLSFIIYFLPWFLLSWFPDAHFMYGLTAYSFLSLRVKNMKQTRAENTCSLMRKKPVWCFPSRHLVMRFHYLGIWHDSLKWE